MIIAVFQEEKSSGTVLRGRLQGVDMETTDSGPLGSWFRNPATWRGSMCQGRDGGYRKKISEVRRLLDV